MGEYLIARWGDCAMEIPELLEAGFKRMKQNLIDKTKQAVRKCNTILDDPDAAVRSILANNSYEINVNLP